MTKYKTLSIILFLLSTYSLAESYSTSIPGEADNDDLRAMVAKQSAYGSTDANQPATKGHVKNGDKPVNHAGSLATQKKESKKKGKTSNKSQRYSPNE